MPGFRLGDKKYSSVITYVLIKLALELIDYFFFPERNRYLGYSG